MKSDTENVRGYLPRNPNMFQIRQKYRALYVSTLVRDIGSDDIKLPYEPSHWVKSYQVFTTGVEVQISRERGTIFPYT